MMVLRLLCAACSLALAMATGFVIGQLDEKAAWLERGPVCANVSLSLGNFELRSKGAVMLQYGDVK